MFFFINTKLYETTVKRDKETKSCVEGRMIEIGLPTHES